MKFIKLSNGAVFAVDKIALVARKDINQYMVFIDGLPGSFANADASDVAAIEKAIGEDLIVVEKAPEPPAPKTKLVVANED